MHSRMPFPYLSYILGFFSVLLSSYYSYNINTVIINKNFDYGKSMGNYENDLWRNKYRLSLNEITLEQKSSSGLNESKAFEKKLTFSLVFRKVACCRVMFCRRKIKTRSFYTYSMGIIRKYLSVEQIFFNLIENLRFKNYVIENKSLSLLESRDKLVLNFNEKVDASCEQAFDYNKFDENFITEENVYKT
jgi:hypothetical protein